MICVPLPCKSPLASFCWQNSLWKYQCLAVKRPVGDVVGQKGGLKCFPQIVSVQGEIRKIWVKDPLLKRGITFEVRLWKQVSAFALRGMIGLSAYAAGQLWPLFLISKNLKKVVDFVSILQWGVKARPHVKGSSSDRSRARWLWSYSELWSPLCLPNSHPPCRPRAVSHSLDKHALGLPCARCYAGQKEMW